MSKPQANKLRDSDVVGLEYFDRLMPLIGQGVMAGATRGVQPLMAASQEDPPGWACSRRRRLPLANCENAATEIMGNCTVERGNSMKVGGVVLCGGRSSRMGRPKAWLPFGAEVMLPRVVRLLGEAVHPVVVVAASGQDVPPLPDNIAIARDDREGRGPLQGLDAGLNALRGQVDAIYLSSCDAPFLRPAFVRRLIDLIGDAMICVPRVGGYHNPLAAVYRLEVADAVARLLAADKLRPSFLFSAVPTRIVEGAELADVDPMFESLRNLNTPEEYEAALRDLSNRGR